MKTTIPMNTLDEIAARAVISILLTLILVPMPAHADQKSRIFVANKTWKIAIDPATLQVTAALSGSKRNLVLSAAQPQPLRIANVKTTPRQVTWELPDRRLIVSMRLEGDALVVNFTAHSVGQFTWPILPSQNVNRGYILPIGEGVYAPAHDAAWRAYLTKQEGFSTTESLSLPLWGIDDGSHTLTYLATNPFNNELAFQSIAGSLAARFTHHFTRNHKVKTYGLRISLGPSSPIEPAKQYRRWLVKNGQFVSMKGKIKRTPDAAKLLGAAHVYLWGDGTSPQMMDRLYADGFDRLWLGSPNWKGLSDNRQAIQKAKDLGYLIGPYDSYDSVHSPDAKSDDTWESAQFDQNLYDTGGIVLANGKKKTGFQRQGYYINATVAQPYVKERVTRLMKAFDCNSWFIDCDAAGEFYDDYSPQHPSTQEEEMRARLRRMAWIRNTHRLVIGSEGGSAYSGATIHFAHGMMTKVFGWDDADLKNRNSPYFLGAYYPPGAPAKFFEQVPLKPAYYRFLFDPRFRLPLYQTVFHDSVVTTHHWTFPTLKFKDQVVERSLLELLYSVPPLYHLNTREFARQEAWMKSQYAFFSPLHREVGLLPLTDFAWLTTDRRVQRTIFGGTIEIIANFRSEPFTYAGHVLSAQSVLSLNRSTGKTTTFTPGTGN